MSLRSARFSPIGLDIGARFVKAVQVERTRSTTRICAAASIPRTGTGAAMDAPEARRIVDVLCRQGFRNEQGVLGASPAGTPGLRLVLALPHDRLLTSVLELPARALPIGGASGQRLPIDDIARQELARSNKCEPDQIEFGWWELPPPPGAGRPAADGLTAVATHVMAVGCRTADADALLDHFDGAGAEVAAIDTPSLALARACAPRLVPEPGLTSVLEIGWSAAHLLVLRGTTVLYERSMKEHGLGSLTGELKTRLGLEPELCGLVLAHLGRTPVAALAPAGSGSSDFDLEGWEHTDRARAMVAAHADGLADEIRLSLAYGERRFGSAPGMVLITGGGANTEILPDLASRVRERTGVDAASLSTCDLFPVAPGLESVCTHAPLALALGLALHQIEPVHREVNA